MLLLNVEQVHVEDQRSVRRNVAASAVRSVPQIARDLQSPFAANMHSLYPFIPTLNDSAGSELELERFVAINGAVELLSVAGEPAGVMDLHSHTRGSYCTGALLGVPVLQSGWSLRGLASDLRRAT